MEKKILIKKISVLAPISSHSLRSCNLKIPHPAPPNTAPLRSRIALPDTPSRELCTKTPHLCTRISVKPQFIMIYANRSVFRGAVKTKMDNNQWRNSGQARVQHGQIGRTCFQFRFRKSEKDEFNIDDVSLKSKSSAIYI